MNEVELYRIHHLEGHEKQRKAELLNLAAHNIQKRQHASRVRAFVRLTLVTLMITAMTIVVLLSRSLITL